MEPFLQDDEFENMWFLINADLLASHYGYSIEYIENLDAILFLSLIRCIQKREAESNLLKAHIASMVNADVEGWDSFKASLGFTPLSTLALAAKHKETDLSQLGGLKDLLGE